MAWIMVLRYVQYVRRTWPSFSTTTTQELLKLFGEHHDIDVNKTHLGIYITHSFLHQMLARGISGRSFERHPIRRYLPKCHPVSVPSGLYVFLLDAIQPHVIYWEELVSGNGVQGLVCNSCYTELAIIHAEETQFSIVLAHKNNVRRPDRIGPMDTSCR